MHFLVSADCDVCRKPRRKAPEMRERDKSVPLFCTEGWSLPPKLPASGNSRSDSEALRSHRRKILELATRHGAECPGLRLNGSW